MTTTVPPTHSVHTMAPKILQSTIWCHRLLQSSSTRGLAARAQPQKGTGETIVDNSQAKVMVRALEPEKGTTEEHRRRHEEVVEEFGTLFLQCKF